MCTLEERSGKIENTLKYFLIAIVAYMWISTEVKTNYNIILLIL